MEPPETHYARSGDVHIAYQVFGSGPRDLLIMLGPFGNVEHNWTHPAGARFLTRLASFSRVITMDMRGVGLSDRSGQLPSHEHQMDDVNAVLDAVGSERPALFALSQAGPLAVLFAATYPARTAALILYATYACLWASEEYPWGRTRDWMEEYERSVIPLWGTGATIDLWGPSVAGDAEFRRWWAEAERLGFSPGGVVAYLRMQYDTDVRHVLPTIQAPTLVLQRADDLFRDPGHSRYIAEHVPGARYVELPGRDHAPFVGDTDAIVDEVEEFLTGVRPVQEPDRVLATVLFTDIVGSTRHAVELGDRGWRETLSEHDRIVQTEIDRYRGRLVKATGDGCVATFDGPARGVRCAGAIRDRVRARELEIRAGLHTGEIELVGDDVAGIAVHLASRVMVSAEPGEVVVSSTVKDLVAGSGLEFEDRGEHELKGVPGAWRLFGVRG
jgi:class 3 adenylate cyclase